MKNSLSQAIEAVLFFKTDAMSIRALGALLGVSKNELEEGLKELEQKLAGRGIGLVRIGEEVMLSTAPVHAALVEKISKEEREGPLSKASMETLSIILYKNGVTKSEIDYIRGVNSGFILRALQIRGLVERTANPADSRSFLYQPTFDLYNHLGIKKKEDLPDYEKFISELDAIQAGTSEEKPEDAS